MKTKTRGYLLNNYESLKYLSDEEIAALLIQRFNDSDITGALDLISYKQYQDAHMFTLAELGL